jgi:hypothetical protein
MRIGVNIEFCNVNIHPKGTVVKGFAIFDYMFVVLTLQSLGKLFHQIWKIGGFIHKTNLS